MHYRKLAPLALATLFAGFASTTVAADTPALSQQEIQERSAASRDVIQKFAGTLKGELQAAMKSGGPTEAIRVCNERAPEIAADLSAETGMQIGRTSLKLRNPNNAPDRWERLTLQGFEAQRAAGTAATDLPPRFKVEGDDGKPEFRFMAAIPTGGVCLTCHGSSIDSDVQHALERLYPEDRATGFSKGDVRGAFTITQEM
ncbi:MAG: Tll0287-like domain-containing protein [Pseudomonadota bacterium]